MNAKTIIFAIISIAWFAFAVFANKDAGIGAILIVGALPIACLWFLIWLIGGRKKTESSYVRKIVLGGTASFFGALGLLMFLIDPKEAMGPDSTIGQFLMFVFIFLVGGGSYLAAGLKEWRFRHQVKESV